MIPAHRHCSLRATDVGLVYHLVVGEFAWVGLLPEGAGFHRVVLVVLPSRFLVLLLLIELVEVRSGSELVVLSTILLQGQPPSALVGEVIQCPFQCVLQDHLLLQQGLLVGGREVRNVLNLWLAVFWHLNEHLRLVAQLVHHRLVDPRMRLVLRPRRPC